MSWDQEPPRQEEMGPPNSVRSPQNGGWDSTPPDQNELQPVEAGFSKMALNGAEAILQGLDYAGGLVRTGVGQIAESTTGRDFIKDGDWQRAADGKAPGFSEMMANAGVPEGPRVNLMPEVRVPGTDVILGRGDSSLRDIGGFVGDLATDPLNYLTLGSVAAAKGVGKGAAKTVGKKIGQAASKIPGSGYIKSAGSAISTGGRIAKETGSNAKNAVEKLLTPKVADDFEVLAKIAEKNDIPKDILPDSIEFGPDSIISRAGRSKAEGPLGEEALNKFNEGLDLVRNRVEKKINDFGGGYTPDAIEAGNIIREGFDKGVENFFNKIDMTHNKLVKAIPGLQVAPEALAKIDSKLSGLEKWAKGRVKRGFTQSQRTQAEQVLRAVNAVRNGSGSYKQTLETLRDIGEIAFKSKNQMADIAPDIQKFRDLYFTIDDALIDTAGKAAGEPVASALKADNKLISEFFTDKSVVSGAIGNKTLAPEKLFNTLVKNGDSKKIAALKKILPPEDFNKLKSAFLNSQIRKNADDVFTFKGFHNSLRGKKELLGSLLDPREAQDLAELVHLGHRWGDPVLSYSGTGASNAFRDVYKAARSTIENDALIDVLKTRARKNSLPKQKLLPGRVQNPKIRSSVNLRKLDDELSNLARISPAAARLLSYSSSDKENGTASIKGESRWKLKGYSNLSKADQSGFFQDPKMVNRVFASKKGQKLLIEASNAKPGSKRMKAILKKLEGMKQ